MPLWKGSISTGAKFCKGFLFVEEALFLFETMLPNFIKNARTFLLYVKNFPLYAAGAIGIFRTTQIGSQLVTVYFWPHLGQQNPKPAGKSKSSLNLTVIVFVQVGQSSVKVRVLRSKTIIMILLGVTLQDLLQPVTDAAASAVTGCNGLLHSLYH